MRRKMRLDLLPEPFESWNVRLPVVHPTAVELNLDPLTPAIEALPGHRLQHLLGAIERCRRLRIVPLND